MRKLDAGHSERSEESWQHEILRCARNDISADSTFDSNDSATFADDDGDDMPKTEDECFYFVSLLSPQLLSTHARHLRTTAQRLGAH
jgi:hypothetical protein